MNMKAVVVENYDSIDGISIEEIELPDLAAGQVRVRIGAAAVGFVDGLKVQGLYQTKDPLPFVPGAEFAGIVDATADDVTAFRPGVPVIGMTRSGALAEYISVPTAALKNLPPNVPLEAGASFQANYLTGLYALGARAELRTGEILLVLGAAGGVGLAAIEIGKILGARVIACASTDDKLAVCRAHGADETINYATEDLRERIKALTGSNGADVVYDPVGGSYTELALRSIAWRGRLLVVGFAAGEIPKIPLNLTLLKGCSIVGVFWGDWARREPAHFAEAMARLDRWYADGKLKPHISATFPLARAADALTLMASRRVTGKVVLTVG
jgi:NADPH2:quinone reductase